MKRQLSKKQIRKIVRLRETGHSLPEIRRATGHSNGTVFKYIKDVRINPEFVEYWHNRRKSSIFRRDEALKKARIQARQLVNALSSKEKILIATALYWAEGAKKDFALINTDPSLIKTFVTCILQLGIKRENLGMSLRIYEDIDRETAIKFWVTITGIHKSQITSVSILKGKKNGKLQYGMCRVRVTKGGYFLKLLHALSEEVKQIVAPP